MFVLENPRCKKCLKHFCIKVLDEKGVNGAYKIKYAENDFTAQRSYCYECKKSIIRKGAKEHRERCKAYEKTKKGFLVRVYRNMQSRVTGVQKKKFHLYKGKSLLKRDDFYEWAMRDKDFHKLFKIWKKNKYLRLLTPSVDRIDSFLGYKISNMEWVTFRENSRRGSVARHSKLK